MDASFKPLPKFLLALFPVRHPLLARSHPGLRFFENRLVPEGGDSTAAWPHRVQAMSPFATPAEVHSLHIHPPVAKLLFGGQTGLFLLADWVFGGAGGVAVYGAAGYTVCRAGPKGSRGRGA